MFRPIARALTALIPLAAATALNVAPAAAADRIDFGRALQPIDGFGFSEAFQRATLMQGARGLTPQAQREVLGLLLDRRSGAGLSILRLGIGSSADSVYDHMPSIEPADPGGPGAKPVYTWDSSDGGQVWLARQARAYGVRRFYADAWSAPGFMKDNGSDSNGGTLCGLSGTSCPSGDWRRAYANYLVQYTRFYQREGIRITDLGFTNEPDWTASYASMRLTPAQAAEFVKVLGPVAARAHLKVACCDSFGWNEQAAYTSAIAADPQAARWVVTYTGHSYASAPESPPPTTRRAWMSEWSPNGSTWNENWDDGSGYDGFAVAQNVHDTLTKAGASGYLYWLGASTGATRALIQLDGATYHVSKRLWAVAAYSRFIRPGAVRVPVTAANPALEISAFRNADGSRVVEVLNTATTPVAADLAAGRGEPRTYLTDASHALTETGTVTLRHGTLAATFAPRSLTTVVIR
ncbi:MAG: Ricin lectin [Actinomycetia bacterium]|nr:Ricin lectin [Actinomycetes bacterium]